MGFFSNENTLLKIGAVLVIIGLAVSVHMGMNLADSMRTPLDYLTASAEELKEGEMVEGDLYFNYGTFEEEYHTDRIGKMMGNSTYYYLIPVGEAEYMGLRTGIKEVVEQLDRQTDEAYAYIYEKSEKFPSAVHFKGKIEKMTGEDAGYYTSYLKEMGFTGEEIERHALKSYINVIKYEGMPVLVLIFSLVTLAGAAMIVIYFVRRKRGY